MSIPISILNEATAREQVVECGRRMHARGLIAGAEGNISVLLQPDRIIVTPSGVNKGFLHTSDLIVVNAQGQPVEGDLAPSSELKVHLAAYRANPTCRAVVHAHPPTAVAMTIARQSPAPCLIPEAILGLGEVVLAPYATPSTEALAAQVESLLAHHVVVMMERHGSLTLGRHVFEAFDRLEALEQTARITWLATMLGPVQALPADEVDRLRKMALTLLSNPLSGAYRS